RRRQDGRRLRLQSTGETVGVRVHSGDADQLLLRRQGSQDALCHRGQVALPRRRERRGLRHLLAGRAEMTSPRSRFAILLLMTAVALGMRLVDAGHSLWLDETATAWVLDAGFADVPDRAWLNNLSPVYYWLAGLPAFAFGRNEVNYRLLSILAGAA